MVRDRTEEFLQKRQHFEHTKQLHAQTQKEMTQSNTKTGEKPLPDKDVNDGITHLEELAKEVKILQRRVLTCIKADDEKRLLSELKTKNKNVLDRANNLASKIRKTLDTQTVENENNSDQDPLLVDTSGAQYRMRRLQYIAQKKRLKDIVVDINEAELNFTQKRRDILQRQYEVTNRTLDENEMNDILEKETTGIFIHDFESARDVKLQLQEDLQMAKMRHEEIQNLEKSVVTVHQMFLDIQFIVSEQGEMIDRIEDEVNKTKDYVQKGNEQLVSAKKKQTKSRKLKFIIGGVVIGLVLLIVIIAIISTV